MNEFYVVSFFLRVQLFRFKYANVLWSWNSYQEIRKEWEKEKEREQEVYSEHLCKEYIIVIIMRLTPTFFYRFNCPIKSLNIKQFNAIKKRWMRKNEEFLLFCWMIYFARAKFSIFCLNWYYVFCTKWTTSRWDFIAIACTEKYIIFTEKGSSPQWKKEKRRKGRRFFHILRQLILYTMLYVQNLFDLLSTSRKNIHIIRI